MAGKLKYDLESENPYVTFDKPQLNPFTRLLLSVLTEEGSVVVEDIEGRHHNISSLVRNDDDATTTPYFVDEAGEHSWELNGKSFENPSFTLKKFNSKQE